MYLNSAHQNFFSSQHRHSLITVSVCGLYTRTPSLLTMLYNTSNSLSAGLTRHVTSIGGGGDVSLGTLKHLQHFIGIPGYSRIR